MVSTTTRVSAGNRTSAAPRFALFFAPAIIPIVYGVHVVRSTFFVERSRIEQLRFNGQRTTDNGQRRLYFAENVLLTTPVPAYASTAHSFLGRCSRQSRHIVVAYCAPQCGHTPPLSNVSNGCWQFPHFQKLPNGGAVRQLGHANPARRGSFASFSNARARCNPPQHINSMNTQIAAVHTERIHTASPIIPAMPTNPSTVATIRLRARPSTNHNSERRICPPSSG